MKMNSESENVLKALSSSTRRTIMRQISEKGSATYTEIMQVLGLDPSLMSGTFNYHLKELSEAGLVERTDGEYRISDLGKRALILVDQVAKDVKIDKYGVLSAVMSMSPRKELSLFLTQMGMMIGFMCTILSSIPFIFYFGTGTPAAWISSIGFAGFLLLTLGSLIRLVSILRKYKLGFSVVVFLSYNWFFIRSPNRNSFFVISILIVVTFLTGTLSFLLPFAGNILLFSGEWFALVGICVVAAVLAIALGIHARRVTALLEETDSDQ
jgi:DNA-binding transcriptional ArsR family regulator